jgi:type I restriction enzyme R subunit
VAELARLEAEAVIRARESAEESARREATERATWEQLAQEAENAKLALAEQLAALQAAAQKTPAREKVETLRRAEDAAKTIDLDEATTRAIIDRQLQSAAGPRIAKPFAMPAEPQPRAKPWRSPMAGDGPADYALFIGMQLIAVVEAKRRNKNVSAAIDRAERYSRGFKFDGGAEAIGNPWEVSGAVCVFGEWPPISQTTRNRAASGSAMPAGH